jgi:dihydrofolate reductase
MSIDLQRRRRRVILRMLTSIDGFIADPAGDLGFGSRWSEELQRFYAESFSAADGLVYGRVVYERYVPYWEVVAGTGSHPDGEVATEAEMAYATLVRELPKYVVSDTLTAVQGNATILRRADLVEEIAALRSRPGGDLFLMCGPALLSTLSAKRLVDKYMLDVYPVALGRGVHLFRAIARPIVLSHLSSRRFPQGVNVNVYKPEYVTSKARTASAGNVLPANSVSAR